MMHSFILCAFAAGLLGATTMNAQETARLSGQVVSTATGLPVQEARVRLFTPPVDETPEYESLSDDFGFLVIKDVAPGEYTLVTEHPRYIRKEEQIEVPSTGTNRVVRIAPVDAEVFFDILFDVRCLSTHVSLQGANVAVEYWQPDGSITGAPDQVFNVLTDAKGTVNLVGMLDGFYRFSISRVGWEPITYTPPPGAGFIVVDDKVRLTRSHFASAYLTPIRQNLDITVMGFDPVANGPNKPLKAMVLGLIGWDLLLDAEAVPEQSARTGEDGTYKFRNLPPIAWKLVVARHGYVPKEIIITPQADGTFAAETVEVQLEPTKVNVMLSSIYQTPRALTNAVIRLQGIRDSNTEGINRDGGTAPDAEGNTASVLFENLLPGRYWLHVVHQTTIDGLPNRSGPIFAPSSFEVAFYPKETYAEVPVAETEEVRIHLDPVPARIRGRLMATDELANVESMAFDPEPNRVWRQIAHDGIIFREHEIVQMLPDGTNSFTFDSDEAGNYTALIPPGIFGVQIPTMVNYTGHNIEFGDLTAGEGPRAAPWPYPDVWPYQTLEFGHHGAGLALKSGHEYQLDFFMHAHYINMAGRVSTSGEPFGSLILRMNPDGSGVVSVPYSFLQDAGAEVVATGPNTYRAPIRAGDSFVIRGVLPGTYTITLDNPNYVSQPTQVTIAPWQAPGIIPAVAPFTPTYFFPGISHLDSAFNVEASWTPEGQIRTHLHTWIPGEDAHYSSSGSVNPHYFRMSGLPNRLFSYGFGPGIPPSYTIWVKHGDGWFSASGTGSAEFDAYQNGPNENTPPNQPPTAETSYTLDLHAYSRAHRSMEIPGVTVLFQNAPSRPAGGEVAHEGSPYPSGATNAAGQWNYAGAEVQVVDYATRLVRVDVLMDRAMLITGRVHHADIPIPGAAVVLRNRYGNPIQRAVTGANGLFTFPNVTPQPVFVDVNRRGFIPQRKRLDPPSVENPDTGAEFDLAQIPAPTVNTFTMNRFGLFLPGVSKVGDSSGFDPEAAREKLTMTWKATTDAESFTYSLPGFVGEDEQQKPTEQFTVQDKVTEVWLVDRRAFTNAFVNDLNQEVDDLVRPPARTNLVTMQEWIQPILGARKDGKPYYVIHRTEQWAHGAPENEFEGEISLWELPSGAFVPMLVALTESGGVVVKDYELPPDQPSLQGLNLPPWIATMLEAIGLAANLPKFESAANKQYGKSFMNIDTFKPTAEARIGLDPFTNTPAADNSLTYKYVLGVELAFGSKNGKSGPVSAGPKFLGIEIPEVTAEFEIAGKDKEMIMAIVFPVDVQPEGEQAEDNLAPSIAGGAIRIARNEFSGSGKLAFSQILNTNWLGENTLAKYGLIVEFQGLYDAAIHANASLLTRPFPALSGALTLIDRLGLSLYGVFEFTGGAKYARKILTEYPPIQGGTVVVTDHPPDFGVLGRTEFSSEGKIILRAAVGARLEAGSRLDGTILAQLGAPPGFPDQDGIFFTVNLKSNWPPITKIEGAFTILARVGVNLWTAKLNKTWRLFDVPFMREFGADTAGMSAAAAGDFNQFILLPLDITYTQINAASAPPEDFRGDGNLLIDQFYGAGALDLTETNGKTLVYTGIDPDTGEMKVMVSLKNGTAWSAPVEVARAAGILSVASHNLADGRILVAWSEIAEADLSNPFPSAQIRFALFDGSSWSAPAVVLSASEALFDLSLVSAGADLMLLYLSTAEGPVGENHNLNATIWNGAEWSPAVWVNPTQPVATYDAASLGAGAVLVVTRTPSHELLSVQWNGLIWESAVNISTNSDIAFALASGQTSQAVLAWVDPQGAIAFSTYDSSTSQWSHQGELIPDALTTECRILPLTFESSTVYLIVWSTGKDTTEIWAAYVDDTGVLLSDPHQVTHSSTGIYSDLHLSPLEEFRAMVVAQHATETSATVHEFEIGLPTSADCDGNGILDADEIASGTAQDCNGNGVPDLCEILDGSVQDENLNGVPDTCEPAMADDCNRNGLSDTAELEFGLGDLDGNGVLDDCESAVQVSTVPVNQLTPGKYYRAPNLRIISRSADALELEYEGTLEQADQVQGPWNAVP